MTPITIHQLFAAQAAAGILSNPGETGATPAQHIATGTGGDSLGYCTLNSHRLANYGITIGIPVRDWPGRCYEVACKMVAAGCLDGVPTYGLYRGPVARGARAGHRASPINRHGWITNGSTIYDPTRWVFERVDPRLYITTNPSPDYDAGGNDTRRRLMGPCPRHVSRDPSESVRSIRHGILRRLGVLMGDGMLANRKTATKAQLQWLANAHVDDLGSSAPYVYRLLVDVGMVAWIPLDNLRLVLGDPAHAS